jgi:phospholipid-binding lipoprotein MlaA
MRVMLAAAALMAGVVGEAHAQEGTNDPFEPVNRVVFGFNAVVDRIAIEPIARGYRAITPRPVRTGVSNVLHNLRGPVIFFNDVLQGEPGRAGTTAVRFGLNSTVGVVGIFDVADAAGFERHDEDFGQTLGTWGVGSGPYLVLPLLGPSNLRDTVGRIGDAGLDPLTYVDFRDDEIFRGARVGLTILSTRESLIEVIDQIRQTAVDPYVTTRTGYTLARESQIRNGVTDLDSLPDFEEAPELDLQSEETPATPLVEQPSTTQEDPTAQDLLS